MIFWSIEDLATTTTARDTSAEGLKCASRKLHSCTCHIEIQTLIEATELCYGIDRLQDNIIDVIIKQWSELWIWKCRWVLSYWESCETRHVIIKLWSELWFGNAIQYHTENFILRILWNAIRWNYILSLNVLCIYVLRSMLQRRTLCTTLPTAQRLFSVRKCLWHRHDNSIKLRRYLTSCLLYSTTTTTLLCRCKYIDYDHQNSSRNWICS